MFVAAAICPHPPLLVPAAMGSAGWPETQQVEPEADVTADAQVRQVSPHAPVDTQLRLLRAACYAAVRDLASAAPDLVVVVGSGPVTRSYPGWAAGSLRGLGVPFTTGEGEPGLPLSLTIGSWLIRHCLLDSGPGTSRDLAGGPGMSRDPARTQLPGPGWQLELHAVAETESPQVCLDSGRKLASRAPRVALLVVGDGTARRSLGASGVADPLADRFDTAIADALATADTATLARLDPAVAEELVVSGRVGWQVLAGAAGGVRVSAQLRFAAAPLAISYFVGSWACSG